MLRRRFPLTAAAFVGLAIFLGNAEASQPEFGRVIIGAPYSGGEPSLPGAVQATLRVTRAGDAWTSIAPGDVTLPIGFSAEMKKGYIVNYKFGDDASGDRVV